MRRLARMLLFTGAVLSSGCFRMTIHNGQEPAAAPVIEDRWRSTTVLDLIDIDTPIRLESSCKETGWAKIEQRRNGLNWLVDVFLAGAVYESTHVDVYCARGRAR
jgi:hypothetical protein